MLQLLFLRENPFITPLISIVAILAVLRVLENISPAHVKAFPHDFQNELDHMIDITGIVQYLEYIVDQIFGRFRRIQIRIDSGAQGRITGLAYGAVFLIEHDILILTLAFRLIQSQIGAVIQGLEIFSVIR